MQFYISYLNLIKCYDKQLCPKMVKKNEHFDFILETKGRNSFMDLRTREQLKIHCGKKHFEALDNGIEMQVATDWREIKARV